MDAQSARWLDESIAALHSATTALRELDVEILGAGACTRRAPTIHVVEPGPIPQDGRYVRCVLDRSTHYAEINERTATHG